MLRAQCKNCILKKQKERYDSQDGRGKRRKADRLRQFKIRGITEEIYNKMFDDQYGCCKICLDKMERSEGHVMKTANIDHCHKTNKVRGLLCQRCNTGLGKFRENISILERAILYVKQEL